MGNKAVLMVNLGSPDTPEVPAVRRYLKQFLMDPDVITLPWVLRKILVSLFILPTRPKASAHAYQSVWLAQGSPLIVLSQRLLQAVQAKANTPVALGMRYGQPSIESQLLALSEQNNINEIILLPLYPHYATSTVRTSIKEAQRVIDKNQLKVTLSVVPPFYDNPQYISALLGSYQPWLDDSSEIEHLLFSYHGLPEAHIKQTDPTKQVCLLQKNCCASPSAAHKTCYRHQVIRTTECFVEQAGLRPEQYSISFQSRLGRQKWLEPSTEHSLRQLAQQGVKHLHVICPAFVTDCLETLEEIEMQGKDIFVQAGGSSLTLIPCLNNQEIWVNTLVNWIDGVNAIEES